MRKFYITIMALFGTLLAASPLLASDAAEAASAAGAGDLTPLAKGICISVAAFGGALGQGKAVAAACEGISRNPSAGGTVQLAMIIGLAFIESLVIYALVICFMM